MSATEERLRKLVDGNLEIEGRTAGEPLDLGRSIAEAGVPSPGIVAFRKLDNEAFGVDIAAQDFAGLLTPGALIEYLDANAA